jgi:DNA-binding MarR family transcriptional regulator
MGLETVYRRPGFLLRRAHQIAAGIFEEECAAFELTPQQHGVLSALAAFPDVDQVSVGRLLAHDRSTVGIVVKRLVERGLVRRRLSALDKRRHKLRLTVRGERLLADSHDAAARAQRRLLAPFTVNERASLLGLLERLVESANDESRVPLDRHLLEGTRSA